MKKLYRIERLEKELLRIMNNALLMKANDPRLEQITITEVQVSPDMQYAKLFFSTLDEETEADEWVSILTKATGFLKKEIAETKIMRRIPEIRFIFDDTGNRAREVEAILKSVREESD